MFLVRKTFSDEMFSPQKVFFLNQIEFLVTKNDKIFHHQDFKWRGYSEEMSFVTKSPILSLKVLSDEKLDF